MNLEAATKADEFTALLVRQGLNRTQLAKEFRSKVTKAVETNDWAEVLEFIRAQTC